VVQLGQGECSKMRTLNNIRHERFAQNVVSGLSLSAAYIGAGYKKAGASANAARLLRNESIASRVAELRHESERDFVKLQITQRNERLQAAQERWNALREVIQARKTGDYSRAVKTGLCVRRERVIGTGENAKLIEEYEVDTRLLDAMMNLEKQVAIETGQWTEKQKVTLRPEFDARVMTLRKAFSLKELEEMERRMIAAAAPGDDLGGILLGNQVGKLGENGNLGESQVIDAVPVQVQVAAEPGGMPLTESDAAPVEPGEWIR
jgi:hypothetical protein